MNYYLAIDIGASSGRHMLSHIENGDIVLEEIYRFKNGVYDNDGDLCWDTEKLFAEVLNGIKKCKEIGKIPTSVGIDTWGVDFVLLDKDDKVLGKSYSYRNFSDPKLFDAVNEVIDTYELYEKTGIQRQSYNSIYQLMYIKKLYPELMNKAETLLFIPEYLTYLLSGVKKSEYTIASTSSLVNVFTCDWDKDIIRKLGLPEKIFNELCLPGTVVGGFSDYIKSEVGFDCNVIFPCMHDTASAVAAVPKSGERTLYISSGTWSLLGIESEKPRTSRRVLEYNYTNEGGYDHKFRFLKNIMGLWMIQSIKKEYDDKYSFDDICNAAKKSDIKSLVDCQDIDFLAPKSMIAMVKSKCRVSGSEVPETMGDVAAVIYNSLAVCYSKSVKEIETITGIDFDIINIVGGGSKDDYLNAMTAKMTGKTVWAGPSEATSLGNLAVQMLAAGEFSSLSEARECIGISFNVECYMP